MLTYCDISLTVSIFHLKAEKSTGLVNISLFILLQSELQSNLQ